MIKLSFKKLAVYGIVVALSLQMMACGTKTVPSETTESVETTEVVETVVEEVSEEIELVDQAGRTVVLEQPASTIVSSYYITSYAMIALGLSDSLVGIEAKADTRPIYAMAAPSLLELPNVGSLKEYNVEAVAALEPELVVMPTKLTEQADILADLGIPTLVVDPETREGLETMLTLIGQATGKELEATALITYYHDMYASLETLLAEKEAVSVYMGSNSSYLETAPAAMYQNDLITSAGGSNVAADLEGDYWTEVSYETLLAMNPEVIVIPPAASYTIEDIYADETLADLVAVQNNAVYQMPKGFEEWDSPVPSGILGVLWLSSKLHADVYGEEIFVADATSFYEMFYGISIDASLLQ